MKVKDESINSKLLECAKAEFMEKGFADASMRTIAERAGVTTGMLYRGDALIHIGQDARDDGHHLRLL